MAATRHSGLECLRIISIILIVSMHILGNTFHTSNWLNKEFILFINTLGNTGVTLFICSPFPFSGTASFFMQRTFLCIFGYAYFREWDIVRDY